MIDKVSFMEKFENYSAEELEEVKQLVERILEERSSQRFNSLMNQMLNTIHCFQKEFPSSGVIVNFEGEEINLLDYDWDNGNFYQ